MFFIHFKLSPFAVFYFIFNILAYFIIFTVMIFEIVIILYITDVLKKKMFGSILERNR